MEILKVTVGDFSRRSQSLVVRHSRTTLPRGLERGESVVVSDGDFHWAATVLDIDFELEDTVYRLHLGARLEADEVQARVRRIAGGPLDRDDLLDLLGQLRTSRQVLEMGLARAEV